MTNRNRKTDKAVVVWDPLVRVFHWSLVISFLVAYLTQYDVFSLHNYAGYFVFLLLVFRIFWGFRGSKYARFSNFIKSPNSILLYLRAMFSNTAKRHIGHNPAGGGMILTLLTTVGLTCVSGFALYGLEGNAGPLLFLHGYFPDKVDDWIEETHTLLSNLMAAMVILHIAGVIWSCFLHRENLVLSIVTGKKRSSMIETDNVRHQRKPDLLRFTSDDH